MMMMVAATLTLSLLYLSPRRPKGGKLSRQFFKIRINEVLQQGIGACLCMIVVVVVVDVVVFVAVWLVVIRRASSSFARSQG